MHESHDKLLNKSSLVISIEQVKEYRHLLKAFTICMQLWKYARYIVQIDGGIGLLYLA